MKISSVHSNTQDNKRRSAYANFCIQTVLVLLLCSSEALAQQGQPPVTLPEAARGEKAIQVLGEKLPEVARAHGLTASRLRELFRSDGTLIVDRTARLLYADPEPLDLAGSEPAGAEGPSGSYPLEDTFKLHSRPGSNRVIYLDFDGHVIENTAWNANTGVNRIVAPAWDIDGNPSTFSDQERQIIQKVWQRVSEDYAAMDVDVTTEYLGESVITRSSTSDSQFGTRVLISPIASYFGNYGGYAYIGVFDYVGTYYQPALVFPEKLANHEKYIAEASSHEAGHNVGLNHDGTRSGTTYYAGHGSGDTGWAPIMGNSYSKNLTQFSKGEYPDANNTQDDYAVMLNNGLSWAVDDHGDALNDATALPLGSSIFGSGLIEQRADVDLFRFESGTGSLVVDISPESLGPNLDIRAELLNSVGTRIAESNPTSTLNASISSTVSEGVYFLRIEGVGKGDTSTGYSDYASVGRYSFVGSVPATSGNRAPTAVASASSSIGAAPLAVAFSSSDSSDTDGTIVSYLWDFGDGATSTQPQPSYTYTNGGTFTVTLTVTDDQAAANSDTLQIRVDAVAPTLSISSPSNGASVQGIVPIAVTASDDTGVAAVEFYIDGSYVGSDSSAPYSFSWDSNSVSDGSHVLVAVAHDNYGHSGTSAAISVNVENEDSVAPSVSITSPSDGSTLSGSVAVMVNASDNIGVSYVEFYIDGMLRGSDFSAPYSFNWDTTSVSDGSHSIYARAYDAASNVASSATLSVTVANVVTLPTMAVSDIGLTLDQKGPNTQGLAMISVRDQNGAVVKAANIVASWSLNGAVIGTTSGSSNGQGVARLQSDKRRLRAGDVLSVTVVDIVAEGYQYDASANTETTESAIVR